MNRLKLLTRIALFSSLIYIMSWVTSVYPNVNLLFFIIFTAGFLWGKTAGFVTGAIGMGLWTLFNPYGPANPLTMLAQVVGAGSGAFCGALFAKINWEKSNLFLIFIYLEISAVICTFLFYLPVNMIDAWMYGPFWERFVGGMIFASVSFISNMIIFPILFPVSRYLYYVERDRI